MKKGNEYFFRYIRIAPLSLALWRGVEAKELAKYPLVRPILDIGCGFGEFGGVFFDSNVEMGIDINRSELLTAAGTGKYQKTQRADARALPFKKNSYMTVISVSTIEHITSHHQKVFHEIYRVLQPGGRLFFTVPTSHLYRALMAPRVLEFFGLKKLAYDYFRLYNKSFKHVYLPEPVVWRRFVERAGFQVEQFQGTLSTRTLFLFEAFLPTAFLSQIGREFFGRRLVAWPGLRTYILGPFQRFVEADPENLANILVIARKPKSISRRRKKGN